MKNIKRLYFIVVFLLTLFSFNLKVDARPEGALGDTPPSSVGTANELSCVYENGYKLTQDSAGKLTLFKVVRTSSGSYWKEYTLSSGKDMKFEFDSAFYNASNDVLTACPKYFTLDDNVMKFDEKNQLFTVDYEMLNIRRKIESDFKELTCLYEKKGNSNNRNVDKVVLSQNKEGLITVFKNKEDVGLDDGTSYWKVDYVSNYFFEFEVDGEEIGVNYGGLTSCPKSKTTLKYPNTGGVKFFNDDSGEEKLVDERVGLANFLTATGDGAVGVDKNVTVGQNCDSINKEDKWLTELDTNKYSGSCLYQDDTPYGCHIIELNLSSSSVQVVDSLQGKVFDYYKFNSYIDYESFTPFHIKNTAESIGCPPTVVVDISQPFVAYDERIIQADISYGTKNSGNFYQMIDVRGNNAFTGEKMIFTNDVRLNFNEIRIFEKCEDLFNGNEQVFDMISSVITLIKIAIPLILFGLGVLDFIKAVFSGNEDGMKKAQSKFIKRILIAVCIFLIPFILKLILTIANGVWGNISTDLCGLL